jgi:hypothetical protein
VNTYAANKTKIITNSQVLNWQGYFWDNSFVAMYGYRKDRAESWTAVADTDTEGRPLLDSKLYYYKSSASVSGHSNSWSAVWHLNKLLKERLPLDVSLFYNRSENFQPLAGRVGPTGELLPAPTGRTKDMGVLLATKDGKYSLKINNYETTVTNSSGTSGFSPFYLGGLFTGYQAVRNVFKFEVTDGTNPSSFHSGGNPANWTLAQAPGETADQALARQQADVASWDALIHSLPASFFSTWKMGNLNNQNQLSDLGQLVSSQPTNLNIIENNVSKGYEFELYGQPIRNLRLTLNASKSTAIRNNVGDPTFIALVDQINTALNTTPAGDLHGPSSTAASALTAWNANFWASWLSVKGQENSAVPELRKWRANFVANYDFDRGMLKGFNIGGGVRWQDRVIIGYLPRYYDINGKEVDPWTAVTAKFDLNKPYYGPSDTAVDVFVGYSHRINKNLNWRSQINVRNVNSMHSKLIPVTVQPDGTVAAWRIAPAMVWSLTNTVEF